MATQAEAEAFLAEMKEFVKTLSPLSLTPVHGPLRRGPQRGDKKSYEGMELEEEDKLSPVEETRQQRYLRKRGAELLLCRVCDKKVKRARMSGHAKSMRHRLALALLPPNTVPPPPAPI